MKIIVTGNAGFIGSHLVDTLIKKGHIVYGIDDLSGGFKRNINPKCNFIKLDISSPKTYSIVKAIKADILCHLAADATEGRSQFTPISSIRSNFLGYMNVLAGTIAGGVKKVILTSSMSVYGAQKPPFTEDMLRKPEDIYAVNKVAMERVTEILSQVHGFIYTIIRPHNVFGERQNIRDPYRNVIGIWMNRIMNKKAPIIYGDGKQIRSFSYIDNCIPPLIRVIEGNFHQEIINIGPEETITLLKLANVVLKAMKCPRKPLFYPDRPLEVKKAFCSSKKAKRLLGYKTTITLQEGIERMALWAKELGPQPFQYLDELELPNVPLVWKKKIL